MGLLLVLFLTSFLPFFNAQDYRGYRLPDNLIPSHYDVFLNVSKDVFDGISRDFEGQAKVTFKSTIATKEIKIHAKVKSVTFSLTNDTNGDVEINTPEFNETTSIWTITLKEGELVADKNYVLAADYIGELSNTSMKGFYLSSYNDPDGKIHYLGTTQFEPVHAREAFPCFDEPKLKANFDIQIAHPSDKNALANTPPISTEETEFNYIITTFKTTPLISTYLIAFVVSDFTCSGKDNITNDVPQRVCSSPHTANYRDLATTYTPKIVAVAEEITNINYSDHNFGKLDQIAVPDFSAGAMENWGLVTYREAYMLYEETETPETYKRNSINVIAHELTHQWFGDLVTMDWWDYIFLNEGFARLYQYFITYQIPDLQWELNYQFIVDQVHTAMVADGSSSSLAITAPAASPQEISAKFDNINYNKAACIIRMVWNIMGEDRYLTAIREYLVAHASATAVASDLVAAFNNHISQAVLPDGIQNFTIVMENWLNKPGYPVVQVSREATNVILTQKRFLYNNDTDDTQWYVPITYTTKNSNENVTSYTPTVWLKPGESLTIPNVITNSVQDWILINNQRNAFYRVDYDIYLWANIAVALTEDHTKIDVINRAQIVDDLFAFARSGRRTYSQVLSILSYLSKETEYYPWVAANTGLNYLISRLSPTSKVAINLKQLNLQLLEGVNATVAFNKTSATDQVYTFKRSLVLTALCRLEDDYCVSESKRLFNEFKTNNVSVEKDIRTVVYCTALRYSDKPAEDYKLLWDRYETTHTATEKVIILQSLGCVNDNGSLKQLLDQSFEASSPVRIQDLGTVMSSVYSYPEGVQYALDYAINNIDKISQVYSVSTILSGVASRLTTQSQLDQFETKIANLPDNIKTSAQSALNSARTTLQWSANAESDLDDHFATPSTPGVTTPSPTEGGVTTPSVTTPEVTTPGAAVRTVMFSTLTLLLTFIVYLL